MGTAPTVRQIAQVVREATETLARRRKDSTNLGGYCLHASLILDDMLRIYGYKSMFVVGNFEEKPKDPHGYDREQGHCWVEVYNYVVDVTVTQFNSTLPAVYVARGKNMRSYIPALKGKAAIRDVRGEWVPWISWYSHGRLRKTISTLLLEKYGCAPDGFASSGT